MATTNRGYATPITGTEVDTWGDVLNANAELVDNNIGAVSTVALTNVNVTLSSTQYKCGTVRLTGTLSGNVLVLFPNVSGWWTVENLCTGNFYVAARLAAGGNQIGIPPGEAWDVLADGTNMKFRNLPHPVGGYWDYSGSAVPNWVTGCTVPPYLICDGTTFSAVTYPFLNTVLGGTTLPDARGRARFALNGGTSRITTAGSSIDGDTRLAAGGAQNVTLDTTMIPSHSHSVTDPTHVHAVYYESAGGVGAGLRPANTAVGGGTFNSAAASTGITLGNTGGGLAHNNMTPAYIGGITMIRAGG